MDSLAELFDHYGTDKNAHGYTPLYATILHPFRHRPIALLEVGVGTLNPAAPSTMHGFAQPHYRPGGSLRAWRDWLPLATIWGMDNHLDCMILEPRIGILIADSTWPQVADALPSTFDIIIDDASHDPAHQEATFANLAPSLRPGGLYFIEDVHDTTPSMRQRLDALPHFQHGQLVVIAPQDTRN